LGENVYDIDENVFSALYWVLVGNEHPRSSDDARSLFLTKCNGCQLSRSMLEFVPEGQALSSRCANCRKVSVTDRIPERVYFLYNVDIPYSSAQVLERWHFMNHEAAGFLALPMEYVYSSWLSLSVVDEVVDFGNSENRKIAKELSCLF